jgi:hypothetical protein
MYEHQRDLIQGSFEGIGRYTLADHAKRKEFMYKPHRWAEMKDIQKDVITMKFHNGIKRRARFVTSKNGVLTLPVTSKLAGKGSRMAKRKKDKKTNTWRKRDGPKKPSKQKYNNEDESNEDESIEDDSNEDDSNKDDSNKKEADEPETNEEQPDNEDENEDEDEGNTSFSAMLKKGIAKQVAELKCKAKKERPKRKGEESPTSTNDIGDATTKEKKAKKGKWDLTSSKSTKTTNQENNGNHTTPVKSNFMQKISDKLKSVNSKSDNKRKVTGNASLPAVIKDKPSLPSQSRGQCEKADKQGKLLTLDS